MAAVSLLAYVLCAGATTHEHHAALSNLTEALQEANFTAPLIKMLASKLRIARRNATALSRFKDMVLLSDTSAFSRTIQTTAGSHMGLPYVMFTHDPSFCVWMSGAILRTGWWEKSISAKMLSVLDERYLKVWSSRDVICRA